MKGLRIATVIAVSLGTLFVLSSSWTRSLSSLSKSAAQPSRGRLGTATPSLQPESIANQHYQQAIAQGHAAVAAYELAQSAETPELELAYLRRERSLWGSALNQLTSISPHTLIYSRAAAKIEQYQSLQATADQKLLAVSEREVETIIADSGLPSDIVHFTLCQVDYDADISPVPYAPVSDAHCRQHQGDQLLTSAASLIKVPIAIALMDRLNRSGISYSEEINIDPGNFTENAAIANGIEIGQAYPLEVVMAHMIKTSDNIATNQLIDYVSREQMAQTMQARGYGQTLVDFKLAGNAILPADAGTRSNQLTTDDLTAMVVHTAREESPGDAIVLQAMADQNDRELGHQALQDLSDRVVWLGEKTGQNDRLLGTTVLFSVDESRYVLSVGLANSGDAAGMRQLIRAIATDLMEQGPLRPSSVL